MLAHSHGAILQRPEPIRSQQIDAKQPVCVFGCVKQCPVVIKSKVMGKPNQCIASRQGENLLKLVMKIATKQVVVGIK